MSLVRDITPPLEIYSIATVDGKALYFTGEYYLQAFGGFGLPPLQYQTRQGYRQHGESVVAYSLQSRNIQLAITTMTNVDRDDFWRERSRLMDFFRPNRGTDGLGNEITLTVRRADNTKRAIQCRYTGGLEFGETDIESNNFNVQVVATVTAFNPIWYDTEQAVNAPVATEDTELVFPITFPIVFGNAGTVFDSGDLDYQGTWRSYPIITILGPYSTCRLENTATGAVINLLVGIPASDRRILTLTEEGFSLVDALGVSKFNELGSGSNLVGFDIRPPGELAAGATQKLVATLVDGIDGVSQATFEYFTRFIGI